MLAGLRALRSSRTRSQQPYTLLRTTPQRTAAAATQHRHPVRGSSSTFYTT